MIPRGDVAAHPHPVGVDTPAFEAGGGVAVGGVELGRDLPRAPFLGVCDGRGAAGCPGGTVGRRVWG